MGTSFIVSLLHPYVSDTIAIGNGVGKGTLRRGVYGTSFGMGAGVCGLVLYLDTPFFPDMALK